MSKIVVVGAGREGKGFIGQVFSAAGWDVVFLDKDPKVIKALKEAGSYRVKLLEASGTREVEVKGYQAFECDEQYSCQNDILDCDLITLCLYPEDIAEASEYLARGLEERAERNGKDLTIFSCTNLNHFIKQVEQDFSANLSDKAQEWFKEHVAVRDVIVRRSTGAENSQSLSIESLAVASLLIQKPVNVDLSQVEWMELTDDLEKLKDIKLYTYNAPHATCAYAGYFKGYQTIGDAEKDMEVKNLMDTVLKEAVKALSLEFSIDEERLWKFCLLPAPKEVLIDYIYRVGFDPVRKLGRNDRLTGNAYFCYKHGLPYDALAEAIAYGFAYDEPRDDKAMEIQKMIRETGINETVSRVCGLPQEHEIVKMVIKKHNKITAKN